MPATIPYDRERAVKYATEWAYRRNPGIWIFMISAETAQALFPNAYMMQI